MKRNSVSPPTRQSEEPLVILVSDRIVVEFSVTAMSVLGSTLPVPLRFREEWFSDLAGTHATLAGQRRILYAND